MIYAESQIIGFRVIEEKGDEVRLEVECDVDPAIQDRVMLTTNGILADERPRGFFGHGITPVPPGKNKVVTTMHLYPVLAPAMVETKEIKFGLYHGGQSAFVERRFPFVKQWLREDAPPIEEMPHILGGTTSGAAITDFQMTDARGKEISFHDLIKGRKAFIYPIVAVAKNYEKLIPQLQPLAIELNFAGIEVIGLYYLAGTKFADYSGETWPRFGTVLNDSTGLVSNAFDLDGRIVLAVDEQGIIRYKGRIGNRAEILDALDLDPEKLAGAESSKGFISFSDEDTKETPDTRPPPNLPAPTSDLGDAGFDWNVTPVGGTPIPFSSFKGKTIFLNFWATWCGPCILELPLIQKLYEKTKGKGVEVMVVSWEEPNRVREWMKNEGYTFPVYTFERPSPASYASEGIPVTFIISPDGKVVHKRLDPDNWDHEVFVDWILSIQKK